MKDFFEDDWSEARQKEILSEILVFFLLKQNLPGLEMILFYDGRKVYPEVEVPSLSYEPYIKPFNASFDVPDAPHEGIVFHYSLKPKTKVPPECSCWSHLSLLDRRISFTISLNKEEYLVLGYIYGIVLP